MRRRTAPLLAAVVLAFAGGCTIGPGHERAGGGKLTVTRDFGRIRMVQSSERGIPGGETAMRFLQRRARVQNRYGGRFVNAIDGVASRAAGGRRQDWFYYVNGIESAVGAAEHELSGGDRVWWDYRDWTAAMRVPAVVGSFPEPFVHGTDGKRFPVRIDCAADSEKTCSAVMNELERSGISASTTALGAPAGKQVLRFVIGKWKDVRNDAAARELEQGPAKSGVFARVLQAGGAYQLELLDEVGHAVTTIDSGAGIVAATRFEEQQPTWVVAGIDDAGLAAATKLLDARYLRDRYAVATIAGKAVPLPLAGRDPATR